MDHFESVISTLLEEEGYWVRRSFKVNLTPDEKRQVGKPTIPRPEIDLLALKFSGNETEVIAFEAKSFLDSLGVRIDEIQKEQDLQEGPYKLFTSQHYRKVVFSRLKQDLIEKGMAKSSTTITLGLAAGKVYQKQSEPMREFMKKNNWVFWSPEDIKRKIKALAAPGRGYENDPVIITAKLLDR